MTQKSRLTILMRVQRIHVKLITIVCSTLCVCAHCTIIQIDYRELLNVLFFISYFIRPHIAFLIENNLLSNQIVGKCYIISMNGYIHMERGREEKTSHGRTVVLNVLLEAHTNVSGGDVKLVRQMIQISFTKREKKKRIVI